MRIAIVVGSTRPGRLGIQVAEWVAEQATQRDGVAYELVDLADFDLPLLSEPTIPGAANGSYENLKTQAWSDRIKQFDGYIWVTPEYNHGVPAAMKNAFDVLYVEWRHKAFGFVAYGATGGLRVVEQWRLIIANTESVGARAQVAASTIADFEDGTFAPRDFLAGDLSGVFEQTESWAKLLASHRG